MSDLQTLAIASSGEFVTKWMHTLNALGASEDTLTKFGDEFRGFIEDLLNAVEEVIREHMD